MSKLDFSKLSQKLDIKGMVDSVKSIINPEVNLPPGLENDPIGGKLALIRAATEHLNELMKQQQEEMNKINNLIASLYKDLQQKNQPSTPSTPEEDQKK